MPSRHPSRRRALYCEQLERRELLASISGISFRDLNQNSSRGAAEPVLPGWQVYLDEDRDGQYDRRAHTQVFQSTATPVDLPDVSDTTTYIDVPHLDTAVGKITVTIDITHQFVREFSVFLVSPRDELYSLMFQDLTGPGGDNFTNTTFDDDAEVYISDAEAPFTGTFRPNVPFTGLEGKSGEGRWGLRVYDGQEGAGGTINSWSIAITTGESLRTADAEGKFAFNNLPAGEHLLRPFDYPHWVQTKPVDTYLVTLGANQNMTTANFGHDLQTSSLSGVKYYDANGNNVHDASEQPLAGWSVYLDLNRNRSRDANEPLTNTDATGRYRFNDLAPGDYVVRDISQPGWDSSTSGTTSQPASTAAAASTPRAAKTRPIVTEGRDHASDRVIVTLERGTSEATAAELRRRIGATLIRRLDSLDGEIWRLPPGVSVQAALDAMWSDRNILAIEPDYVIQAASVIPNDPDFHQLYGLHNPGGGIYNDTPDINAPEAWEATTGNKAVVVAVIDSGVDYTHPELVDNMWTNWGELPGNGLDDDGNGYVDDHHGYDFVNDDGDPMDDWYHGTHIAGTIAAKGNNNEGVVGVNWNASIMAIKFLNQVGSGNNSNALAALDYSIKMGARVTNNSWGNLDYTPAMIELFARAAEANQLEIFAAGNFSENIDQRPHYPASYPSENLLTVAASRYVIAGLAYFSNWGTTSVDVVAPGEAIYSLDLNHGYREAWGTSMATPHVAGIAALLLAKNPELTWRQLKETIMSTVNVYTAFDRTVTSGIVDAAAALAAVEAYDAPVVHLDAGTQRTDVNLADRRTERVYLAATVPSGERELFVSDGTVDGTRLLANLSGTVSSDPQGFAAFGQRVVFSAVDVTGERELFISDGTTAGSKLLANLGGAQSSNPQGFVVHLGKLYFTATTAAGERELFVTDGTAAGTKLVSDVSGAGYSSDHRAWLVYQDKLYFTAAGPAGQRELFATTGLPGGARQVANFAGNLSSDPQSLTVYNGKLYFSAMTSTGQRELFVSDGTATGSKLLVNLSGAVSSSPADFRVLNGKLYFSATTARGERELFVSDGTTAGTGQLTNLVGATSANPQELFVWENKLYFSAIVSSGERELYVSDGTSAGTKLLKNLTSGISGAPRSFTVLRGRLYFTAYIGLQREWLSTDGTAGGTGLFKDLSGTTSSDPSGGLNIPGDS